jgi:hypothetical protein
MKKWKVTGEGEDYPYSGTTPTATKNTGVCVGKQCSSEKQIDALNGSSSSGALYRKTRA